MLEINADELYFITWNDTSEGSHLEAILWLLIVNKILTEFEKLDTCFLRLRMTLFFLVWLLNLKFEVAFTLWIFCHWLESLYLQLSTNTSQALTFAKLYKLKRKPTIRINGTSILHISNLKMLELSIDEHLNWFSHI